LLQEEVFFVVVVVAAAVVVVVVFLVVCQKLQALVVDDDEIMASVFASAWIGCDCNCDYRDELESYHSYRCSKKVDEWTNDEMVRWERHYENHSFSSFGGRLYCCKTAGVCQPPAVNEEFSFW